MWHIKSKALSKAFSNDEQSVRKDTKLKLRQKERNEKANLKTQSK